MTDADFCDALAKARGMMLQTASRIVGYGLADDVVADAALNAWRFRGDYDGSATIATWLYAITRNDAVTFLRKAKARPQRVNDPDLERSRLESLTDPQPDPERLAMEREIRELVDSFAAGLPRTMRRNFYRWLEGDLESSTSSDKVSALRARRRLIPALRTRLQLGAGPEFAKETLQRTRISAPPKNIGENAQFRASV